VKKRRNEKRQEMPIKNTLPTNNTVQTSFCKEAYNHTDKSEKKNVTKNDGQNKRGATTLACSHLNPFKKIEFSVLSSLHARLERGNQSARAVSLSLPPTALAAVVQRFKVRLRRR
jgi:hypothetical protein